jgi:hypothetical protein
MMENGKMTKLTGKVFILLLMEIVIKVNGKMTKKTDKVLTFNLMDNVIMENF